MSSLSVAEGTTIVGGIFESPAVGVLKFFLACSAIGREGEDINRFLLKQRSNRWKKPQNIKGAYPTTTRTSTIGLFQYPLCIGLLQLSALHYAY